jgi:hypothetical protein
LEESEIVFNEPNTGREFIISKTKFEKNKNKKKHVTVDLKAK